MEEVSPFDDPISFEIMEDAMVTPCGHSFSKATIIDWLEKPSRKHCPICKKELSKDQLQPNYSLRDAIEHHLKQTEAKVDGVLIPPIMQPIFIKPPEPDPYVIKELTVTHLEEAEILLGRAFDLDPWVVYLHPPGASSRLNSLRWFMSIIVGYGVQWGRLWGCFEVKTMKLLGLAVWQSPLETGVSIWRMFRLGAVSAPWKFGISASWRMYKVLDQSESYHIKSMKDQHHWSLYTVGVDPQFQSKGIGTKLIQPILDLADKDQLPCYLDTSNERSIEFFKRNGFEVCEDERNPVYGPRFWTMIRKPKPLLK